MGMYYYDFAYDWVIKFYRLKQRALAFNWQFKIENHIVNHGILNFNLTKMTFRGGKK